MLFFIHLVLLMAAGKASRSVLIIPSNLMKKNLLILLWVFIAGLTTSPSYGQLAAGSVAPDFTATDITGTTWHLYDILSQGKSVFIDISATWCGPCWSYHNSGALENLYNTYGPPGTNEVMVFFVEGDGATTLADLYGTGTNTQGNWVAGTPYPIIDNAGIASSYAIRYFPTIYMICPDRIVREVGQLTTANLYASRAECSIATDANDAGITNSMSALNGTPASCNGISINYRLCNYGTDPLTSATIDLQVGPTIVQTTNWTGTLQTYESAVLSFTGITATAGSNTATITVSNPNGTSDPTASNNSATQDFLVFTNPGGPAVTEDYSSPTFPPTGWFTINGGSQAGAWVYSTAGLNGAGCAKMDFVNSPSGNVDALILPTIDMTGFDNAVLTFDVAAATYGTSNDNIKVKVSTNCGTTWNPRWNKTGASLATVGSMSSVFTPTTASQWRAETVNLTSAIGHDNVLIKFEALSDQGNNAYIDNVNLTLTTGTNTITKKLSFNLYPNPASLAAHIDYNLEKISDVNVEVVDKMGRLVASSRMQNQVPGQHTFDLSTEGFAKGVYTVNVKTDTGISQQKLVVE